MVWHLPGDACVVVCAVCVCCLHSIRSHRINRMDSIHIHRFVWDDVSVSYANVNPAAVNLPGIQLSFIVSALVSASKENQIFKYKSILSLILCFGDPFDDFDTIKVVQYWKPYSILYIIWKQYKMNQTIRHKIIFYGFPCSVNGFPFFSSLHCCCCSEINLTTVKPNKNGKKQWRLVDVDVDSRYRLNASNSTDNFISWKCCSSFWVLFVEASPCLVSFHSIAGKLLLSHCTAVWWIFL